MKTSVIVLIIVFSLGCFLSVSCSSGKNPTEPIDPRTSDIPNQYETTGTFDESSRGILAIYEVTIDPVAETCEIAPTDRIGAFHFPLSNSYPNVLAITGYGFAPNFWANMRLTHPYPGSTIKGYDPRVIAVLPANAGVSMNYPVQSITGNHSVVLFPDGYTKLHDKTSVAGNVNPFRAYFKSQPFRVWDGQGVTSETQRWDMSLGGFGGPIVYYLIVDVSTNFPAAPQPIIDNAQEPVEINAVIGEDLTQLGGTTPVTATLLDWQGTSNIGGVKVEAPDLFTGLVTLDYIGHGPNPDEYVYSGNITNSKHAVQGWYKLLISTWDSSTGIQMYNEFPVYVDFERDFNITDLTPKSLNITPQGVWVEGNYTYVASGYNGLNIFNTSNPANPIWVSNLDTPGFARDVVIYTGHAYVADGDAGVEVINISNPSIPSLVTTVDTPSTVSAVAAVNNIVYAADGNSGLQLINVYTPSSAYILKTVDTPGSAWDVDVSTGQIACVADQSGGLQVVDCSTPLNATIVKQVVTGNAKGVCISGTYAYITYSYAVGIVDISDPPNAAIINSLSVYPNPSANRLFVSNGYLFATGGYSNLYVFDVEPPAGLSLVNTVQINGQPFGIHGNANNAVIANTALGLQIVDINPPESAYLVKTVESPTFPTRITEYDGYVYLSDDGANGVRILDVYPISTSRVISSFPTTHGLASEIEVSGIYAYIANKWGGFVLATIDPPETAGVTYTLPFDDETYGMQIVDDLAYMTDHSAGVKVLDISTPDAAYVYTQFPTDYDTDEICVMDDYAYIVSDDYGLMIADINPLETASVVKYVPTPGADAIDVEYMDGYVVICDRNAGIHIVDVDPVEEASIVKTIDTPGSALRMVVQNNYAYVTDYTYGIQIIDVFPPSQAHIVETIPSQNWAFDIFVDGNIMYTAEPGVGVRILQLW